MIHTPIQSDEFLHAINALSPVPFVDCSWGNDEADSIWNEEYGIKIWFPNPAMEWHNFTMKIEDTEEYLNDHFDMETVEDIIWLLRRFFDGELTVDGEVCTVLEVITQHIDELKEDIQPIVDLNIGEEYVPANSDIQLIIRTK